MDGLFISTVPPAFKGVKLIWQIAYNEQGYGPRKYAYRETKKEAIAFAKEKLAEDQREPLYRDVSVDFYEDGERAIRDQNGKLIGYRNGG